MDMQDKIDSAERRIVKLQQITEELLELLQDARPFVVD